MNSDPDIPEPLRGNWSLVLTENASGPAVIAEPDMDLQMLIIPHHGELARASDLPLRFQGISKDTASRIADLIEQFHEQTGTPIVAITRQSLLRMLMAEAN